MEVQNGLAKSITQTRRDYDEACKRILAERQIRTRILQEYAAEFQNMSLEGVETLLDDEVEVGTEPVGRDEHAAYTTSDVNAEDTTVSEGTIHFDVRFRVAIPNSAGHMAVEIDLEAQNKWSVGYPLPSRAVFYCARMLSTQGDRILPKSKCEELRKVYSLWVCSRPDVAHRGLVEHFSIRPHSDVGARMFDGYELMDICFVCLDKTKTGPSTDALVFLVRYLRRRATRAN